MKHLVFFSLLAGLALGTTAYGEAHVEEIIRRERAKVGERIDALDSIVAPRDSQQPELSNYVPARYQAAAERAGAVPTVAGAVPNTESVSDRMGYYKPSAPAPIQDEIQVKGEEGLRGEDIIVDSPSEAKVVERKRLEPLFDMGNSSGQVGGVIQPLPRPVTVTQPQTIVLSDKRKSDGPPARLTDPAAARPAVKEETSNSFWDDLNAARERARRALAESWVGEEQNRPGVVNYPSGTTDRLRNELSAAERLAPRQAGLGGGTMVGRVPASAPAQSATDDVIAQEVQEVEAGLRDGAGEKLLGSLSEGEVPLLRPKHLAMSKKRRLAARRSARALSRNSYARGAYAGEERETTGEEVNQVSNYQYIPENFYRHLAPSTGGKRHSGSGNVRIHNAYGESSESTD